MIISVGYQVKSLQGTRFPQWATRVLREHLLRGYTLHERRLAERSLAEAQQAIALLARTLTSQALVTDEGRAVLEVVQRYSRSWRWLLEYDEGRLSEQPRRAMAPPAALTLPEARAAHLLYFVIKDHPFADGNKRIGALLFLDYLRRHGLLLRTDGTLRLADNAMVALALLIAESAPAQKDLTIRLTLNLLEDDA